MLCAITIILLQAAFQELAVQDCSSMKSGSAPVI